jgi:single-strand DNA-binding protein
MAQNIAEFRIIGRIGAIYTSDKVTNVEVAANYHRKDGEDWKTDTLWNRVTTFSKVAERAKAAGKGDLVHITGRVRQNSYEKDGEKIYTVELIADSFSVLTSAADATDDDGE